MAESHETWQASLWIGNEEELYNDCRDLVGRRTVVADVTDEHARRIQEYILDYLDILAPNAGGTLLGDIIIAWSERVDWQAVAEASAEE